MSDFFKLGKLYALTAILSKGVLIILLIVLFGSFAAGGGKLTIEYQRGHYADKK